MFSSLSSMHVMALLIASAVLLGVVLGRWSRRPALRRALEASAQLKERLDDVRIKLDELRVAFLSISDNLEAVAERERTLAMEANRLRRCLTQAEAERDRVLFAAQQLAILQGPSTADPRSTPACVVLSEPPSPFLGRGPSAA